MLSHPTGNQKKRAPMCAVTRDMAEAGKVRLAQLTEADEGVGVTDDQLVSEIFAAMWQVYWDQVFTLQGKHLKAPANLVLPPQGILRQ